VAIGHFNRSPLGNLFFSFPPARRTRLINRRSDYPHDEANWHVFLRDALHVSGVTARSFSKTAKDCACQLIHIAPVRRLRCVFLACDVIGRRNCATRSDVFFADRFALASAISLSITRTAWLASTAVT
jgi:hypothetical protein